MKTKKGFTLLEITIAAVVLCVIIIAAFALYHGFAERSITSEALVNINAIRKGEEAHKLSTGNYVGAEGADQINTLLPVNITPNYFDYRVVGITDDNFIVIATRLARDIASGAIVPMMIAMDKSGVLPPDQYRQYLPPADDSSGSGSGGGDAGNPEGGSGGTGGGSGSGGSSGGGSGGVSGGLGGGGSSDGGSGGGSGGGIGGGGSTPFGAPLQTYYHATLQDGLNILASMSDFIVTPSMRMADGTIIPGTTIQDLLDLIDAENIQTVTEYISADPGYITLGTFNFFTNVLTFNQQVTDEPGYPPEFVASILVHELTHAEYYYDPAAWEQRIEAMWSDVKPTVDAALANGDPNPLYYPPPSFYSNRLVMQTRTDEYFAHVAQAQFWGQVKDRYEGVAGNGIAMDNQIYATYQQGEADMFAYLNSIPTYARLPLRYYDPDNIYAQPPF